MKKNSTILITGASGMIGAGLVRCLADAGYDNLLTPSHAELELRDQASTRNYFIDHAPEYVFHLAARVGGIHANNERPAEFIYENTQIQCNVFLAANEAGVKKLLFPGSACTYPKMALQPVTPDALLTGPIEPTNLAYGMAKANGIVMAQSFAKQYGLSCIVPMPTNTYGVGDNFDPKASHVIPALMTRFHEAKEAGDDSVTIWGSGEPLREFIYVDDVARAFIFLMESYDSAEVINVGTEDEITILELAKLIAEVVGYGGEILTDPSKPDGAPRKCLDSSALRELGWKPDIGLKQGLLKMHAEHFCCCCEQST